MNDYPKVVQVFIGDICNLRCSFCVPRQEAWSQGKKWVMLDQVDRDIKSTLLDKISPIFNHAECLYLTGGGEPLATKAFWEFIEGKRFSNSLFFNTNGTLLTEKNIQRLLQYKKPMRISISVNASSRETYKKIVGEDYFDRVIEGTQKLAAAAAIENLDIKFDFSMVVIKDNIHEMIDFVRLAAEQKAEMVVIQFAIFPYTYSWPLDTSFNSSEQNICASEALLNLYNSNYYESESEARRLGITISGRGGDDTKDEGFCTQLFDFMRFEQNGDTSACCHVWGIKTGKVEDYTDIKSLWNSEKRISMRKTILNGEFPTECQSFDCGFYRNANYRKKKGLPPIHYFADQKFSGFSSEISISLCEENIENSLSTLVPIVATVKNTGSRPWLYNSSEFPTVFGARLFNSNDNSCVIKEFRVALSADVPCGDSVELTMLCDIGILPPGDYYLSLNMLIEGHVWFQNIGGASDYRLNFSL